MFIQLETIEDIKKLSFEWPKVTSLLLTYNQEEFVTESLRSILNQKVEGRFCIVIHDDASTDSTVSIVKEICADSEVDIIFVTQKENKYQNGINIAARLINQIDSQYIAFLEGDDYWTSDNKLQTQLNFLDKHPECGLVHTKAEIISSGLESHKDDFVAVQKLNEANLERPTIREGIELAFGNFIFTPTVMFRKSNIRSEILHIMDGYSPTDWILWSLCCEDAKIGYISESLGAYRLHLGNSWAGTAEEKRLISWANTYWLLASILSKNVRYLYQLGLVQFLKTDAHKILNTNNLHSLNEYHIHSLNWFENVRQTEIDYQKTIEIVQEVDALKHQIALISNSKSWKITAPLRKIRSLAKKLMKH